MQDVLSIWRSPLDKVALAAAHDLSARQPQCTIVYGEDMSAITVYNYGFFVTNAIGNDPNLALTNMFNKMASPAALPFGTTGIGGTAFIPQGSFPVTAGYVSTPTPPFMPPDQSNVIGSGSGGKSDGAGAPDFFHFVISPPHTILAVPAYFFYCTGSHTSGGQCFRSLAFNWTETPNPDVCIFADVWNCRAEDCTFTDCPVAFEAQDLNCGLEACTVQYSSAYAGPNGGGPTGSTAYAAIVLAGPECYIHGPAEILQQAQNVSHPFPTNSCAISFQDGLEHGVVRDVHVNHFSYGITYAIASNTTINLCDITNVEFSNYITCVYMAPSGSSGVIYGQRFTACSFAIGDNSTSATSAVYIAQGQGVIDDVEFTACTAFQSLLHGYEVHTCTNLKIIGGTASGNGPSGGAGIAILGSGGKHYFGGVNLDSKYPQANAVRSQQYAFLCSGNPQYPILVDGCSMHGYTLGSPVSVTGTPTQLIIKNCTGYNDVNTSISSVVPTSATSAATASALGGGSINYYGPSLIIFTNGTSMSTFVANGISSSVPANAFVIYYVASPYDQVKFTGTIADFAWIGK